MQGSKTQQRPYFGVILCVVTIGLVAYFTVAATRGSYGMFRLVQVEAQATRLERELSLLQSEHAMIANKTRRLSNDYLDLDLLDERARKVLGLARADEIVIR